MRVFSTLKQKLMRRRKVAPTRTTRASPAQALAGRAAVQIAFTGKALQAAKGGPKGMGSKALPKRVPKRPKAVQPPVARAAPAEPALKFPKRAAALRQTSEWTGGAFMDVCDALTGGRTQSARTQAIIKGMRAHMKHSALIVPTVPRAYASRPPRALYRGINNEIYNTPPAVGYTVPAGNKGCFASFTRDINVAREFADGGGWIFRLQLDRIARGTPWVWFEHRGGKYPRNRNTAPHRVTYTNEAEVLLPPGRLKVLRRSMSDDILIVDVAYAPYDEYLRRGAQPARQTNGHLTYKTTGGHALRVHKNEGYFPKRTAR